MELSFNLENIDLREFWGINNKTNNHEKTTDTHT